MTLLHLKGDLFLGEVGKMSVLLLDQILSKIGEAEGAGADISITSMIKSSINDLKSLCQEAKTLALGEMSPDDVSNLHKRYSDTLSNLTNAVMIVSSKLAGISPISKVVPGAQGTDNAGTDTATKMVQVAHLKVNTARDNLEQAQKRADAAFERDLHTSRKVS